MISRLVLENFRCHKLLSLDALSNIVILEGNNGVGKTSILESISFFGLGRGIRGNSLPEALQFDQRTLKVYAHFDDSSLAYEYDAISKRRKNYLDEKYIRSQQEFVNKFRILWLTPEMDKILASSRIERRKWFDRLVYNLRPEHALDVNHYEQLLSRRLKILKSATIDALWLTQIEMQLANLALTITKRRIEYWKLLEQSLSLLENWPTLNLEIIDKSIDLHTNPNFVDEYSTQLCLYRQRDQITRRSNYGCHKMDMQIKRNDIDANYLSTGQLKSALIQTTIAHYNMLSTEGIVPILLLDDIFSHFDEQIKSKIIALIAKYSHNQFWITTTGSYANDIPQATIIKL